MVLVAWHLFTQVEAPRTEPLRDRLVSGPDRPSIGRGAGSHYNPELAEREFFLPEFVNQLLLQSKARVRVLPTQETWFGVTYREDLPRERQRIGDLIKAGVYPRSLWGV